MKKISTPFLFFFGSVYWCAPTNAETNKLEIGKITLPHGQAVVLGNGAIDFFMGDEAAFDGAARRSLFSLLIGGF